MNKPSPAIFAAIAVALATAQSAAEQPPAHPSPADVNCPMLAGDVAWIGNAVDAWRMTSSSILGIGKKDRSIAIFFDDDCLLSGRSVMDQDGDGSWSSQPHKGAVPLPDGKTMPVTVASFAAPFGENGIFFAMAAPSVWRKGGVESAIGLEILMTAVLIHEMGHTAQLSTYGRQVSEIDMRLGLADELSDDTLQKLFESNTEYAEAMAREIDLLYKAAAAPTDKEARKLGRAALRAIETRQEKWLTGSKLEFRRLEDLFLTLEGSGQWAGYAWLTSPRGAGLDRETALREFGSRSRFWSQNEGMAIFLVIDRLLPDWKKQAFGEGAVTALEMLRTATSEDY